MTAITATSTTASCTASAYNSLSSEDFISLMLTELTQQDPLEPTKTSDLVVNMREIQTLLTSQQEQQRSDLTWASGLVGQSVTVSQSLLTNDEYDALAADGLSPDIGAGSASGVVSSFKVVDGAVWVTVGGSDYPIGNVTSISPADGQSAALAELGSTLSGRTVSYLDDDGAIQTGVVSSVNLDDDGTYTLTIGDGTVAFSRLRSVQ